MSLGSDVCTADELLGSYALVSQLAAGHLTSLHRAQPVNGAERFANRDSTLVIKRLLYSHVHDQADRELLLNAGRIGMRLSSPHVARVLAVHEDPEPFLVMEQLNGVSLSTLLEETRHEEVLRYVFPILVDVLEGLAAIHAYRDPSGALATLVHGAPAARHVLVGEDGVARLIDLTHATGPRLPVAARRSLRLRADEMAPEQVLAPLYVDARCDLFIVGSVLWRALTGQPLFAHDEHEQTMRQLLTLPIVAPSAAGSLLGERFDRVCLRALARAPGERYASARDMARELKAEAERASLFASRDEIGSLVRTLALANQDDETASEGALTVTALEVGQESVQATSQAPADTTLDILTMPQQGSSLGFEADNLAIALAIASVSAHVAGNDGERDESPALASMRESGTWYEGLPSIVPKRPEPHKLSFALWACAAATLALVSTLIWQSAVRLHDARPGQQLSAVRSDASARPGSVLGFAAFFASPDRSVASSALPPLGSEAKEPPRCAEADESPKAAPAEAAQAVHTVSTLEQEAAAPRARALRRLPSPLPPNPY